MKIATWNVNSLRVRLEQVTAWLEQAAPDVLGLQETKVTDDLFPADAFEDLGYEVVYSGQPTYNGVAVVSRESPVDVVTELDGFPDPERRVLVATYGNVRVFNLYVPNGRSVDSEKYEYKLQWLSALGAHLRHDLDRHRHVVAVGDFNIAPDDRDVHDPVEWEGKILCSPRERAALGNILAAGFKDTFRLFDQAERSFSWWDYRAGGFRRNNGLRIDLVLASAAMSAACTGCSIDVAPRRLQRPSDHTPVVAEFSLP